MLITLIILSILFRNNKTVWQVIVPLKFFLINKLINKALMNSSFMRILIFV